MDALALAGLAWALPLPSPSGLSFLLAFSFIVSFSDSGYWILWLDCRLCVSVSPQLTTEKSTIATISI